MFRLQMMFSNELTHFISNAMLMNHFFSFDKITPEDHSLSTVLKEKLNIPANTIDANGMSTLTYSRYSNTHSVPIVVTETFEQFKDRCSKLVVGSKSQASISFSPLNAAWWHNALCSFLSFKFENVPAYVSIYDLLQCCGSSTALAYTTGGHVKLCEPRCSYQVIVPLVKPVPSEYYQVVAMHFATRFSRFPGRINASYSDPAQRILFPYCPERRLPHFEAACLEGDFYNWLPDFVEHQAPRPFECWSVG